jgi:hypothetical protein
MSIQISFFCKFLGSVFLLFFCQQGMAQTFTYVEPNNASCPVVTTPSQVVVKTVKSGSVLQGVIRVSCGFTEGSYTVTLSSTDPNATFSPKTFLVNFGRLASPGAFTVKFAAVAEHTIDATITSNMGSPVLLGKFVSFTNVVNVVAP